MKLLNVLEVLNFFGYTADNLTNCVLLEDKFFIDLENDNLLAKSPISWVKHDQHYAYSAFWSIQLQSVHIILLGPRSAFSGYECRVWFKIADVYTSKPGKLSYNNININIHNSNFHQYEVHCKPDDIPLDSEPYGVLLGKEDELKLFIPIEIQRELHDKEDLIVCIAPDYSGNSDKYLIEFIAYHTLLGVRHFVAYDIGIHYKVFQFLRSIAGHQEVYKSFSTLLWKFPTVDLQIEKSVLQKDCKLRTQGYAKHSILLSWDQYLVLNKEERLDYLNEDTDYTFEVKNCCINRQLRKSWPMAMKNTICEKTNQVINFIANEQLIISKPTILGSIHKLEEICENPKGKDDKIMARFLIDFVNSKLMSLWKSNLKYSIMHATKKR